jgi:hypothetical protein
MTICSFFVKLPSFIFSSLGPGIQQTGSSKRWLLMELMACGVVGVQNVQYVHVVSIVGRPRVILLFFGVCEGGAAPQQESI